MRLILLVLCWCAIVDARAITYTVPSTDASYTIIPQSQRTDPDDSISFSCDGGHHSEDCARADLYGWASTGGPAKVLASHWVLGKWGRPDTFWISDSLTQAASWHCWVVTADTTGKNISCASNVIEILAGDPITGVAMGDGDLEPMYVWLFNVRGQLVIRMPNAAWDRAKLSTGDLPKGSGAVPGIYWLKARTRSGKILVRRVNVIRDHGIRG